MKDEFQEQSTVNYSGTGTPPNIYFKNSQQTKLTKQNRHMHSDTWGSSTEPRILLHTSGFLVTICKRNIILPFWLVSVQLLGTQNEIYP